MNTGQGTRLRARGPPFGECRWGSRSRRRVGHGDGEAGTAGSQHGLAGSLRERGEARPAGPGGP